MERGENEYVTGVVIKELRGISDSAGVLCEGR